MELGNWGLAGSTGLATGAGALAAGGGGAGGGGDGGGVGVGVLQPASQTAARHATERALLPSFGNAKLWVEGCVSNGVILKKPSNRWVAFCHCTVWFQQIFIES